MSSNKTEQQILLVFKAERASLGIIKQGRTDVFFEHGAWFLQVDDIGKQVDDSDAQRLFAVHRAVTDTGPGWSLEEL